MAGAADRADSFEPAGKKELKGTTKFSQLGGDLAGYGTNIINREGSSRSAMQALHRGNKKMARPNR